MYRSFKSSFIFFIILINITFSFTLISERCRLCEGAIMIIYGLGNKYFNSFDLHKITTKFGVSFNTTQQFIENEMPYITENLKNFDQDEVCWKLNYCEF
ncbi:hypothetical protein DDB_G0289951 [Dictyostelium discoideum AX4]|uniref:Saposin B-type domain-containing protein n=1 Tax=Dictyostelium discoideum TaxID=44689 RepID=Q54GR5_DICDI|nr:hypothetical protein DDB_G0289951 [Dictyostelium discoideum AX4]EAL62488.1 hypothetical protein DDB_G0289951 [Dictyostelium discoideum AX4]|eukprot:XP_636004.1 hypothetical protein DDB_G0289951 [Dictyostelium discoideum AX4]